MYVEGDGGKTAQLAALQQEVESLKLLLEEEGAGRREAEARAENLQALKDKLAAEDEQRCVCVRERERETIHYAYITCKHSRISC